MPAYGTNLTPAAFMETLRPANNPRRARRSTRDQRRASPARPGRTDGARCRRERACGARPGCGDRRWGGLRGGWRSAVATDAQRFGMGRLAAFLCGLGAIVLALASPLDALAGRLLQAHMTQHMLLMMVAPPLLWLGAPVASMLRGFPRRIRHGIAAGLAVPAMRRIESMIAHPAPLAGSRSSSRSGAWHTPRLYELALSSDGWHHLEHACFFMTAMMFWRPVILAWPAWSPWRRWTMIPYLLLEDFQNTVLAAILTMSDRVIYPAYAARLGTITALEDQSSGGRDHVGAGFGRVPRRGGRGGGGHPGVPQASGRLQAPLVAGEDPAGGGGVGLLGWPVSECGRLRRGDGTQCQGNGRAAALRRGPSLPSPIQLLCAPA